MNTKPSQDIIDLAMIHVRASGPVSFGSLQNWIHNQTSLTHDQATSATRDFLQHAIVAGLVEFYDDGESYVAASKVADLIADLAESYNDGDRSVSPEELLAFRNGLQENLSAYYRENYPTLGPATVSLEKGSRYARIVVTGPGASRSAYGFIDLTNGDLLKADGWKKPAKHARGNIRNGGPANWWNGACKVHGMAYLR